MTHIEVYEKYLEKLVKVLPMEDVRFTTQLSSNGILPSSVGEHITSLPTQSNKANHFLKNVIKSSLDIDEIDEFENLLTVMEKCGYPHIQRLAAKIKSELNKETGTYVIIMPYYVYVRMYVYVCILYVCVCDCVYICSIRMTWLCILYVRT